MFKYKKFLFAGNIISGIASVLAIIWQIYCIIILFTDYATEFEDILNDFLLQIAFIHFMIITFCVVNLILILKINKKLKLEQKEFIKNQNLYIWNDIILGMLILTSQYIFKAIFILGFVFSIVGLVKANKKINIPLEKMQEYEEKVKNINNLYESNLIDKRKQNEMLEKLYKEYYESDKKTNIEN
ncbi:MAG: hypothetical protein ACI4TX_04575 [Christensenellales bacterium]